MKTFLAVWILFLSASAFGGNRHIYCNGEFIQMDVLAKGPHPKPKEIVLHGIGNGIQALEIFKSKDNDSYDFHIFYQSKTPGSDVVAMLKYTDRIMSLSVFQNANLVEENISCIIGF